jgi:hypothetical protein
MGTIVPGNFEMILSSICSCLCTVKNNQKDWHGYLLSEAKN